MLNTSCLLVAGQQMYLLAQLKSQGLLRKALHIIFTAIVLSVVTYALPSFAGQLSKADKSRIDSLLRRPLGEDFVAVLLASLSYYFISRVWRDYFIHINK